MLDFSKMRVLVVEDNYEKLRAVTDLLNRLGITDIKTEEYTCMVLRKTKKIKEEYDFIVTDLGLHRLLDEKRRGIPIGEREGLYMLYDLAGNDCKLPVIIYSTTEISEFDIEELKGYKVPFCGQAKNIGELEMLLSEMFLRFMYLQNKKKSIMKILDRYSDDSSKIKAYRYREYDERARRCDKGNKSLVKKRTLLK